MKKIVVIRVITLEEKEQMELHGKLIEQYYPMLNVTSVCIPEQPIGICNSETKALAIPKIINVAKQYQDADAIVISCCDDPAVKELRRQLKIPVIGAGSSVCALALCHGNKVGIIGITDYAPDPYMEILGERMINLGCPENVHCTLDLLSDEGRKGVLNLAKELKAKGADVIALACTGMSTIHIAKDIEENVNLPVIDPVMAEGLFAYYACTKRY